MKAEELYRRALDDRVSAYFVIRAVPDAAQGRHPLASIVTAMFLLAIPATANLISSLQTGSRFAAVDILDGHSSIFQEDDPETLE